MNTNRNLRIQGIPDNVPDIEAALCRSRIFKAVNELMDETSLEDIKIIVGTTDTIEESDSPSDSKENKNESSTEERALKYKAVKPTYDFDKLVVPQEVLEDLLLAVDLIDLEAKVFDEWGLREIEPFPRTALNLYGPPGTGKTLAAHAIASKINRLILVASYADIESMYHGEGPKNVEAIFFAAEKDNALLFIDEADSLLSKRLTNVTQGSEQAINSMRSQLLICLEKFRGVVIFSTNLVENYDKAFETRVRNIRFLMPDQASRQKIWARHLPEKLPLTPGMSREEFTNKLAEVDDVCGRDIKNAVIDAAMRTAREGKKSIEIQDLLQSIERIKAARPAQEQELSEEEKKETIAKLQEKLKETNNEKQQDINESDTENND